MKPTNPTITPPITLTEKEQDFLFHYILGHYNPITAPPQDQDTEIALIEKASEYEQQNNLIDERIDFTPNCDLLKWFFYRFVTQNRKDDPRTAYLLLTQTPSFLAG